MEYTPDYDLAAPEPSPVVALWQAVLWQAVKDAWRFCATVSAVEQRRALDWICKPSEDRDRVFEYAGYDPDFIAPRLRALVLIKALLLARGHKPRQTQKGVRWERPSKPQAAIARAFLTSPAGKELMLDARVPSGTHELKQVLGRAMLVAAQRDENTPFEEQELEATA